MLIERANPLAKLRSLPGDDQRGAIVLLGGEAGIGKSTLLQHYCDSLNPQSHQLKWGSCDPLETPRVLGPLLDMFAGFGPDVQRLLTEEASFAQLTPALLNELENSPLPVVMVFEDVHWADNVTLDLLKCIGRRISFLNTLLIVSYRSDEIGPKHPLTAVFGDFPHTRTHRIDLQPISVEGVEQLARETGQDPQHLHRITAGNPFFLTELLAATELGELQVPASVQDAISARLNRLPSAELSFLETISVIPYSIEATLLFKLFGSDTEQLAENCLQRQLLQRDTHNTLKFRHELARLGTLERLPTSKRKKIHQRILALLLDNEPTHKMEQILCHASGARNAATVLEFAPLLAAKASHSGAHQEAAAHLATALEFVAAASKEQAATLYESWSYEAGLTYIDVATIAARHKALALWRELKNPGKEGENLRWLSRLHWYLGEATKANEYLEDAISVLENTQPSAERAMAYTLKSQYYMLNDHLEEAIIWGNKALEIERRFPDPEVRIHAGNNIGSAMLFLGQQAGLEYMLQSLSLAIQHDLHEHAARVYTNLADYAVNSRDLDLAEKTIADGIVFDTSHDLDSWTYYLVGLLAALRLEQGRLEEAETIAQGVMRLENQTLLMKLPALLVLSKTRLRLGKKDAAQLLEQALENSLSTGESQYILPARLGLIEAAWLTDDMPTAHKQMEQILSTLATPEDKWRGAELRLWQHRLGSAPSDKPSIPLPRPIQFEIDGHYQQAAQEWQSLGSPYQAAVCLMHSGSKADSSDLNEALSILETLYATGAIRKLKHLAKQLDLENLLPASRRGPRKASRQHPLGLTKKEQEILPLVMQGMSNKEISAHMSRSTRTVENHISSILGKFNVSSRMEAMLRVKSEPWLVGDSAVFD